MENDQNIKDWLVKKRNEILDNNPINLSNELELELKNIDKLLDKLEEEKEENFLEISTKIMQLE